MFTIKQLIAENTTWSGHALWNKVTQRPEPTADFIL